MDFQRQGRLTLSLRSMILVQSFMVLIYRMEGISVVSIFESLHVDCGISAVGDDFLEGIADVGLLHSLERKNCRIGSIQ